MTTFTMQDLNQIPVTQEEEEAMDSMSRLGAGVGLNDTPPHPFKEVFNVKPTSLEQWEKFSQPPTLETIINNICTQLQLLSTVIKEGAGKGNSLNAEDQSLQECVGSVLESAQWFREMVAEKVDELVEDKDFEYEIGDHVERYMRNEFSLDDHVDIHAEIESKIDEIVERAVEDKLTEVVEEALRNASIRINF